MTTDNIEEMDYLNVATAPTMSALIDMMLGTREGRTKLLDSARQKARKYPIAKNGDLGKLDGWVLSVIGG